MFDLNVFIQDKVIKRKDDLFQADIEENKEKLYTKIKDKRVLVVGGAGSIGSSFIKALLPFKPSTLVVVDLNENALTELTRDLRSTDGMYMPEDYVTYPMDYASTVFSKMFRNRGGFDIVANFSAHKHVRSEKDVYSVEALIRNNLLNAKNLLDLLAEIPPETYFCVSTDKAANPVNIMGASKRIMEDVIFAYSDCFPVKTARFANVAFSNGSLPDGFLERMAKLQPLSAPLDVKRYFVSPKESGQICLLACLLGTNREIFFPKLDETQMMGFDSIATALLECQGYEPMICDTEADAVKYAKQLQAGDKKYPVFFSKSDTSGEKMYEEFYTENESVDLDRFKSLGVVIEKQVFPKEKVERLFDSLSKAFEQETLEKEDVVNILKDFLPEFRHIETGKSLDSKM